MLPSSPNDHLNALQHSVGGENDRGGIIFTESERLIFLLSIKDKNSFFTHFVVKTTRKPAVVEDYWSNLKLKFEQDKQV